MKASPISWLCSGGFRKPALGSKADHAGLRPGRNHLLQQSADSLMFNVPTEGSVWSDMSDGVPANPAVELGASLPLPCPCWLSHGYKVIFMQCSCLNPTVLLWVCDSPLQLITHYRHPGTI